MRTGLPHPRSVRRVYVVQSRTVLVSRGQDREKVSVMSGSQTRLGPDSASHKPGGCADLLRWEPQLEWVRQALAAGRRYPASLALETVVVTTVTVATIRFLNEQSGLSFKWLMISCLLVTAAFVPTWLRKSEFPPICIDRKCATVSLYMVCCACLCTIPVVFLGLWLMARVHVPIPLRPAVTGSDDWFTWLVYQFLYVAVAEEVFFRGYFQANVMRILGGMHPFPHRIDAHAAVLISAACFALAHVVVQGQVTSVLTFLPGLVLAWLFLRTQSLLAPILFHGLANISYGVIALSLT